MKMLAFGLLLQAIIDAKNINIKKLCEKLEIDRTMLYRYMSNKATAPQDFIDKISSELMLTLNEKSLLQQAYETSIVGEDLFACRLELDKMFQSASRNHNHHEISSQKNLDEKFIHYLQKKTVQPITQKSDVEMAVKYIFYMLLSDKASTNVYIHAQPNNNFIVENLNDLLEKQTNGLKVYHNFRLLQSETLDIKTPLAENLKLHKALLPTCFPIEAKSASYYPSFYYDTFTDTRPDFVLTFPNQIIADQYALIVSEDYSTGVFFRDLNIIKFFINKFLLMRKYMTPYIQVIDLTKSSSENLLNRINLVSEINISPEPKALFLIVELNKNNHSEKLKNLYNKLKNKTMDCIKKGFPIYIFFTKKGLYDLLETGIFKDVNENMAALSHEQKLWYLKSIVDIAEKYSNVFPCMLEENNFFTLSNMNLHIFKDTVITFSDAQSKIEKSLFVFEKSLVSVFSDYFFNVYVKNFTKENKKEAVEELRNAIDTLGSLK